MVAIPAQFGKLKGKILDKILKSKPILTTSLDDATTEVPFLDDYKPSGISPLRKIPIQTPVLHYQSVPGCWSIQLKSYCLHAGKYRPGKGEGYLYAPLKGDWAHIIRSVLKKSVLHPEIPQHLVQSLIWGILARSKISDMPHSIKMVATKLLTPQEILVINGGALGLIPRNLKENALKALPPAVRQVVEAEAAIRDMLKSGIESYEAFERVAVLTGTAPSEKGDREVPDTRWSYHPDGYFVRYQPSGYSRTTLQISVPPVSIVRFDGKGLPVSISDSRGNSLEVEYDDTVQPFTLEKESQPSGYAFRLLRFIQKKPKESGLTKEWSGKGWTLISLPNKKGESSREEQKYYSGLDKDLEWGASHRTQLESLLNQVPLSPLREEIYKRTIRLGCFTHAVENFFQGHSEDEEKEKLAIELLQEAWQHLVRLAMIEHKIARTMGSNTAGPFVGPLRGGPFIGYGSSFVVWNVSSSQEGGEGMDIGGFDLSGDSSVPGKQGNQRLGMGRAADDREVDISEDFSKMWNEYDDGYDQGHSKGWCGGFLDGYYGTSDHLPIPPLVEPEDLWQQGYNDGYDKGYWEGHDAGESMRTGD